MRKRLLGLGIIVALGAAVVPFATSAVAQTDCEWLAGDFHVHTVYSHDSWGGPGSGDTNTDPFEEPPDSFEDAITLGWTPGQQGTIAESRELDFIAITDHDNVDAQIDLANSGWGQDTLPGDHPLIWVPDYENNAGGGGHAQMHGATKVYPDVPAPEVAEMLRADGGAFQINHPADTDWHTYTGDKDGDGRMDFDEFALNFPDFAPDALEIWNIGAWVYEPPFPATNDHEFPVQMYDQMLDRGFRIAATGGSDNHWRSTTAAQGVGQPTTWVCAEDRSADAIVQAVRAGHTTISHQPPAYMGATLRMLADGDADGNFESIVGDRVDPGSSIRVEAANAEGATLRLITNGGDILAETTIDDFNFTQDFEVPETSTWVRAEAFYPDGRDARRELAPLCDMSNELFGTEPASRNTYCENRLAMLAMTSPIYFQEPEPEFDPATTTTYTGPTRAKVGKRITLSATLTDTTGAPLDGQAISFTFRDAVYDAVTNSAGRAYVTRVQVGGHPGSYDVITDFAGTDTHEASHDHDVITLTSSN